MTPETLYIDTSVISAYFDDRTPERKALTRQFWDTLGSYEAHSSVVTVREIGETRDPKLREMMEDLVADLNILVLEADAVELAGQYVGSGAIPDRYRDDAFHIAIASVNRVQYLLSWNFEHVVKLKTKRMVKLINLTRGYREIEIVTPGEF